MLFWLCAWQMIYSAITNSSTPAHALSCALPPALDDLRFQYVLEQHAQRFLSRMLV